MGHKKPGPVCGFSLGPTWIDDGTLARTRSTPPATAGVHASRTSNDSFHNKRERFASCDGTERITKTLSELYVDGPSWTGFEKLIQHLYADSEGNVTIGVGHLVAKKTDTDRVVQEALRSIPLVHKNPSNIRCNGNEHERHKFAAYLEVRERYESHYQNVLWKGVEALYRRNIDVLNTDSAYSLVASIGKNPKDPKNKLSGKAYSSKKSRDLPDFQLNDDLQLETDAAMKLLRDDLEKNVDKAHKLFSDFAAFPFLVKLVVVDVCFNGLGVGGRSDGLLFRHAIQKRDWVAAAEKCSAGKDARRDRWRKRQLLMGAFPERVERSGTTYIV